jgi:hypothetical protein
MGWPMVRSDGSFSVQSLVLYCTILPSVGVYVYRWLCIALLLMVDVRVKLRTYLCRQTIRNSPRSAYPRADMRRYLDG